MRTAGTFQEDGGHSHSHRYRDSKTYISSRLPAVGWAKTLYVSAKTGLRVNAVFPEPSLNLP
jgi:predicted GTPase